MSGIKVITPVKSCARLLKSCAFSNTKTRVKIAILYNAVVLFVTSIEGDNKEKRAVVDVV